MGFWHGAHWFQYNFYLEEEKGKLENICLVTKISTQFQMRIRRLSLLKISRVFDRSLIFKGSR